MTALCYYQYTASGQNFDKLILIDKLNFTIMLHNDMFIHTLMTAHCRWLTFSAFNNTKPTIINNELIKSDFPLTYKKLFCCCSSDKIIARIDCNIDTLSTAYPGQTISLSLSTNFVYRNIDEINVMVAVEINDDVLPPTACKLAEVSEIIHKVYYSTCTVLNFTIVHNGPSYLQWCELFIKVISTNQIEAYYIDIIIITLSSWFCSAQWNMHM